MSKDKPFLVLFWGKMIPLQGVQYIRKAADLLRSEHIKIQILGNPPVPQNELPAMIRKADICLGIFGDTGKAQRVIPNKVYEAIAMRKPVISGDSPAIRELFIDRENILLCNMAEPKDLAEKILELKNNDQLRERIAQGGHDLYLKQCKPEHVVAPLIAYLHG